MQFLTDRLILEPITVVHAPEFFKLAVENREHLEPWEPVRNETHFTVDRHIELCENYEGQAAKDSGYSFAVRLRATNELIGRVSLNNVVRGVFHNAYLGYFMAKVHNGQGLMTEAVKSVVHHAFTELKLHRVQAGVIRSNTGSIRVVEKAGFRKEGLALNYLKINGQWQDHILFAITIEDIASVSEGGNM